MTTRAARRKQDRRVVDTVARDRARDALLAGVVSVTEFRELALDALDEDTFDYIDGGAWDELTLADNDAAWLRRRLRPRVLVDVATTLTASTMLGQPVSMPIAVAPMAVHGLAHPDGEVASARAAAAAGIPFVLSTMSSRSIEDVAAAAPAGLRWFQLYHQADEGRSRALVERAAAAGYGAIVLTVDLPVLGYRERDRRSGFELSVPLGNFADTGPTHVDRADGLGTVVGTLSRTMTWHDLATIRSWSSLPLVLKGVLTAEDARLAADHGIAAVVVSNHGARQLDRTPATADVLEEVVEAVAGRLEVWVDGGIRRGLDVVIALALGARGVLVGRPILYALATGGQPAVTRALAILQEELEIALALVGAPTPADVRRSHVAD